MQISKASLQSPSLPVFILEDTLSDCVGEPGKTSLDSPVIRVWYSGTRHVKRKIFRRASSNKYN